jgi:outer membrane protein OmpA-like peptidoglycan-associated protein
MEINAYADARASDDYNLILSKKRGDWIVEYMIKKGISPDRFIVNAYGETKLIDESNDAVNRRAEIRVYYDRRGRIFIRPFLLYRSRQPLEETKIQMRIGN